MPPCLPYDGTGPCVPTVSDISSTYLRRIENSQEVQIIANKEARQHTCMERDAARHGTRQKTKAGHPRTAAVAVAAGLEPGAAAGRSARTSARWRSAGSAAGR